MATRIRPHGNSHTTRIQLAYKVGKNAKEKQEMEKYPMRTVVGCLLYLSLMTRPAITKAVSAASSIVSNPGKAHWKNVQHIIRYSKKV